MTCERDTIVEAPNREEFFVWRPIVSSKVTPVATSKRFWTSCVVDLDSTGDANIAGSTVDVFAVSGSIEVRLATAIVGAAGPQRVVSVLGQGASKFKVVITGNPAAPPNASREVPISVLCFGENP